MSQHNAVLLLGSNLGDSKENILLAVAYIEQNVGVILKKSKILQTNAVEFDSNNIFCNLALSITTNLSPLKLLHAVKTIERKMGRIEDSGRRKHYKDRIIDIDIVLYDNLRFECEILEIPHQKHLYHRDFSQYLLSEIQIKTTKT